MIATDSVVMNSKTAPRQEGDPQGRHGGAPVGAAQGAHLLGRFVLAPEGLERGQARDEIEYLIAQDLHGLEALLGDGLGHPADENHEDRNEGKVHTTATAADQSWVRSTSTVAGVTVEASTSWGR